MGLVHEDGISGGAVAWIRAARFFSTDMGPPITLSNGAVGGLRTASSTSTAGRPNSIPGTTVGLTSTSAVKCYLCVLTVGFPRETRHAVGGGKQAVAVDCVRRFGFGCELRGLGATRSHLSCGRPTHGARWGRFQQKSAIENRREPERTCVILTCGGGNASCRETHGISCSRVEMGSQKKYPRH